MDMLRSFLDAVRPQKDSSSTDRLNYAYSTTVLTLSAIFISGWSFVGQPIQCWFPAYYKSFWIEYALDYCYVQNTYFLPFTDSPVQNYWELGQEMVHIPQNISAREDKLIGYYQWVPFVLALEAILFYLPILIWRGLYEASGVRVKTICETCGDAENMKPDTRKANIAKVSRFLHDNVTVHEGLSSGKFSFMAGHYLRNLFIFVKFLFAANCLCQFFMLQKFLGLKNFWWGFDVFIDLVKGQEWPQTGNFPRVNLCDYEVRVLGNLHRHTVQCVLLINLFNEKIFVFLWFWFAFVAFCSTLSFFYWLATLLTERIGEQIVESYLFEIDKKAKRGDSKRKLVRKFMRESLKPDGIFLIRLIASNAGDVVCCELLEAMWNEYKKKNAHMFTPNSVSLPKEKRDIYPRLSLPPKYEQLNEQESPSAAIHRRPSAPVEHSEL